MNMPTYAEANLKSVAASMPAERAEFIRKTYGHLAAAVLAFIVVEYLIIAHTPIPQAMLQFMASGRLGWLAFLGGFMLLTWLARGLAARHDNIKLQYAGLGLYVIGEALIFAPLLFIAVFYSSPDVLPNAAIITGLLFAALTFIAFFTKKDFSFLGSILTIGGFVALGCIVAGAIFGFNLGLAFAAIMVVFAGAAILYDTSKVIHNYAINQYVGASLELFASVMLLFWYVLLIVMRSRK